MRIFKTNRATIILARHRILAQNFGCHKMDGTFRTLYIENFPLNTTATLLHKLFTNFGPLKGVDLSAFDAEHPMCRGLAVPKAKGYAFVEFANQADSLKACKFFNDLSYILTAASKLLGQSELITKIEETLEEKSSEVNEEVSQSLADLRQSILSNLEFRKLLLIRVMTKHKFQDLTTRFNELRFQSQVRAARMLAVL